MRIWLPSNWVTVKTVEGEETIVPTVIGKQKLLHGSSSSQVTVSVTFSIASLIDSLPHNPDF